MSEATSAFSQLLQFRISLRSCGLVVLILVVLASG